MRAQQVAPLPWGVDLRLAAAEGEYGIMGGTRKLGDQHEQKAIWTDACE